MERIKLLECIERREGGAAADDKIRIVTVFKKEKVRRGKSEKCVREIRVTSIHAILPKAVEARVLTERHRLWYEAPCLTLEAQNLYILLLLLRSSTR